MAPTCTIHAAALSEFMRTEGLRLTDLADKSGVSIGFLSELCSGTKTRTSPATALKIAEALGVRISAISLPEGGLMGTPLPPPTAVEQAWLDEHPAPPLSAEQARRSGVLLRAGIEQSKAASVPEDVEQAS